MPTIPPIAAIAAGLKAFRWLPKAHRLANRFSNNLQMVRNFSTELLLVLTTENSGGAAIPVSVYSSAADP
jgi:hypothetical protein